jgi:hypothetical protein
MSGQPDNTVVLIVGFPPTVAPNKDIYDVLATGNGHYVLLYDTGKETGYYLPTASVVLHMTHDIISRRKYGVFRIDRGMSHETCVAFAEPGPDGAAEVTKALKRSFGLSVRKDESETFIVEENLSKLPGRHGIHLLISGKAWSQPNQVSTRPVISHRSIFMESTLSML